MVIEDLGPTFIKLAQVLSNRPDIIPAKLIVEFEKLQNDVQAFSYKIAKAIVEKELNKKIEEVFSFFDSMPLGSASIGQVYRARLISGEDVVVKIQRPGVVKKVKTDLQLLREFVSLTENYFVNLGILNPLDIVDAFEETMIQELDYNSEAKNIMHFRKIFKHFHEFELPEVYTELSGKKILVMSFISGCKVDDVDTILSWGLKPKKMAKKTMHIYLSQIFEFGVFHGDPHPGNILVQPDGTIALIDFGMVGALTKKQKYAFSGIMIGLAQEDYKKLAANIRKLASNSEIIDMVKFESELQDLVEDFRLRVIKEIELSDFTIRLQRIIYENKLQVPGIIFVIFRALAILEGIGNKLDPNFEMMNHMRPFGLSMLAEQYSLSNISSDAQYNLTHLASLLYSSPIDVKYILKKWRAGELKTNIELIGYEPFLLKAESITNRIIITLLIFALVVGSSIIYTSALTSSMQKIWNIPIIPFIGFSLSLFLFVVLFLNIVRNRNKVN
jgi:ubiquinone biosynthesis protein